MLTILKTFARYDQVVKVLDAIKTHVSYEQNLKNLTSFHKDDLKKVYGYLMGRRAEARNNDDIGKHDAKILWHM